MRGGLLIYKIFDKWQSQRDYEKDIINNNQSIIHEKNIEILKVVLIAMTAIFAVNYALTFLGNKFYIYLRMEYLFLITLCLSLHLIIKKFPKCNSTWAIFIIYSIGVTYSIFSSGYASPNDLSVLMLALIFQVPVLYVDKSWRINLFVIIMGTVYLIAIYPYKSPILYVDEIINIFSFSVMALIIGKFTRIAKLENYTMKTVLHDYAYSDQLTKLSNRRQLFEDLTINETIKENPITAFAIIDIDDFKKYNDTYGHQGGDECLCAVSQCFLTYQNNYNVHFYRYGGEEFLVSFKAYSKDDALNIANKLRVSIEMLQIPHLHSIRGVVTVSIGLAYFSQDDNKKYELLISKADKALYTAKRTGKNMVIIYSE